MPQNHSVTQEIDMGKDWRGAFDEHGVQFLVLDRHGDSDLLKIFRSQSGWTVDFEDEEAVIFGRISLLGQDKCL